MHLQAARDDGLLSAHQGHILHYGSAMGVDLSRFDEATKPQRTAQSRQKLSIAPSAFVLGYVGRPVARKGFHLLLKAWERTRLAEFGGVLLIAGCDQNDCKQALGHEVQGVIALGYVRDVDGFYAACDAIALPSDHEGFPTAMLEGAAAGLATIGSDVPGIRCTIIDGETGILVPPKDQAALARAIRQLAEYPNLRHMMGAAGRQRVVDKFQSHEVLNSLVHYYENVLGISIPEVEELRRKKAA